ncbi:MAG: hypothetical protein MUF00_09985 [Gemmatimonadaceae bacterium]|jgi:adhesin/invasin|nr:hypothetical protein [Gemmatimonadaceae bacterium]
MHRNRLAVGALLLLAACGGGGGDNGTTPPPPLVIATLAKVTPDPVQPVPGARVQVQVSARTTAGIGVPGAVLTTSVSFGGAAQPGSVATDANGLAEFTWFLAPSPGLNSLTVTSANGITATFTTTSAAPTAASLVKVTPDQTALNAGSSIRIRVATVNAGGQRIGGVAVQFAATGGGTVAPADVTSDASGEASTVWTFGSTPGANTLVARTTNNLQASYAVQTITPPPVSLVIVGTPPASAVVRSAFPLTVEARDSAGRGMRGVSIAFSTTAPTTIAPATAITDSLGRATTTMTLAAAPAVNTVEARTTNGLTTRASVQGLLGPPVGVRSTVYALVVDSGATVPLSLTAVDIGGNALPPPFSFFTATTPANIAIASVLGTLTGTRTGVARVGVGPSPGTTVTDSLLAIVTPANGLLLGTDIDRFRYAPDSLITITMVLDTRNSGVRVGAATLRMNWDPAVLVYRGRSAGTTGVALTVNDAQVNAGALTVSFADLNGIAGRAELIRLQFRTGGAGGRREGSVSVTALDLTQAGTFDDLLRRVLPVSYPMGIR